MSDEATIRAVLLGLLPLCWLGGMATERFRVRWRDWRWRRQNDAAAARWYASPAGMAIGRRDLAASRATHDKGAVAR